MGIFPGTGQTPFWYIKKYPETNNKLNIKCPATRFANNRMAKLTGRTTNVDTNSMKPTKGFRATGSPGGQSK